MRLSEQLITDLKNILEAQFERTFTDEDAQLAGLAVLRLVPVEELRQHQLFNQENEDEKS